MRRERAREAGRGRRAGGMPGKLRGTACPYTPLQE